MTAQKASMDHKTPPSPDPVVLPEPDQDSLTASVPKCDTEVVLTNPDDLCQEGCYRKLQDAIPYRATTPQETCDWKTNRRIGVLMLVSVLSLYLCVFWLIYALSKEGTERPGLFISATCILFIVALFITVTSMKKLCVLLRPKHVWPAPV